jgi:hypothetical protein
MAQFHKGQEVEVFGPRVLIWRKAKIVKNYAEICPNDNFGNPDDWIVELPNGARIVLNVEHIRAINPDA